MSGILIAIAVCVALIVIHHFLYPAMMMILAKIISPRNRPIIPSDGEFPLMHMVIPACNEGHHITDKIRSIAKCDYPSDRLVISILNDGSTDNTADDVRMMQRSYPDLRLTLHDFTDNQGKLARLNAHIPSIDEDIVVLSDASALLAKDALYKLGAWFQDPKIGVVGAGYGISDDASFMQRIYWKIQSLTKQGENRLGCLIGAHGAFYAIRKDLFTPLKPGTINDDFIIPMNVALSHSASLIYDPAIQIFEAEVDSERQDLDRRLRIGAGNFQQILQLAPKMAVNPLSFHSICFFFGKILRVAMGPTLIALGVLAIALAWLETTMIAPVALAFGSIIMSFYSNSLPSPVSKLAKLGNYILMGHIYSLVGVVRYVFARDMGWKKEGVTRKAKEPVTHKVKRAVDFTAAASVLLILSPLVPLLALLIKMDSPGPVIFKQYRIGRARPDQTEIFPMYKFRSMRQDAEKGGSPVWAQKEDPRVTRIGKFLRKTRLDELPQLVNVLKGDMSLIGPRPERPGFYQTLEEAIPYFAERTYWVRPGITGLAQTQQGYTETVEEARTKALYDHVYALKTHRFRDWIATDIRIVWDTIAVMALGRGR